MSKIAKCFWAKTSKISLFVLPKMSKTAKCLFFSSLFELANLRKKFRHLLAATGTRTFFVSYSHVIYLFFPIFTASNKKKKKKNLSPIYSPFWDWPPPVASKVMKTWTSTALPHASQPPMSFCSM